MRPQPTQQTGVRYRVAPATINAFHWVQGCIALSNAAVYCQFVPHFRENCGRERLYSRRFE